jgi:hypothetical protein
MSITRVWTGAAASLKDIWALDVSSGAWAPGDTIDLTIGEKTLSIVAGANSEDNTFASGIAEAWNASSRLDGTTPSGCGSNFGGNEFGEFAEALAVAKGSSVIITGRTAGKPIELSVAFSSMTDADVSIANEQVATGCNHWDNPLNWSPVGVPVDGDAFELRDSSTSILYGMPQGSDTDGYEQHDITAYSTWTGQLGLPPINTDNANLPYPEYRHRAAIFGGGTGTHISDSNWAIGVGDGSASRLVNLGYNAHDGGTVRLAVYKTAAQPLQGNYCVHASLDGNAEVSTAGSSSVAITPDFGLRSSVAVLNVQGGTILYAGNVNGQGCVATVDTGTVLVEGPQESEDTWAINGGSTSFVNYSGFVDIFADGPGTIVWNSTGSQIETLRLTNGATFDAEQDSRPFTISFVDLFAGAAFLDGFGRGTYENGIDLNRCGPSEVTLRLGSNQRITLGDVS